MPAFITLASLLHSSFNDIVAWEEEEEEEEERVGERGKATFDHPIVSIAKRRRDSPLFSLSSQLASLPLFNVYLGWSLACGSSCLFDNYLYDMIYSGGR